ncbi:MAG: hypothetical protein VB049_12160 [Candidatus Pelethousia sp.]|nr:hypothetical protein [Candidatus Pelethousia sp.]
MKLMRFALGVRFASPGEAPDLTFAKACMEALFRVLTPKDVEGLRFYGGLDAITTPGSPAFIAVMMGGSLKRTRLLFEKLSAVLRPMLCPEKPFIENNRVAHLSGLVYYGQGQADGTLSGGENVLGLICG